MGQLVYTAIGSLDGFIADPAGSFEWSAPSEEVHSFINQRDRGVSLELYGRRLYEVMQVWETYGTGPDASLAEREYGRIWRERDKIVYSTTLESVPTARTRIERTFDPAAIRRLVDEAPGDVSIGGPTLAAHALRAGIVDRIECYVNPIVVGGGTPWLPGGIRLPLRLLEAHYFDDGVAFVSYDARPALG